MKRSLYDRLERLSRGVLTTIMAIFGAAILTIAVELVIKIAADSGTSIIQALQANVALVVLGLIGIVQIVLAILQLSVMMSQK